LAFRKRKQLVEKLKERHRKYLEAKYKSEHLAKSKSNFFSTVSHELRTPLYGVIGLSSILLEDKSLKSHEKDLKSLKFSADYLLALINDVLLINKLDSKNADNDRSNFNLQELVQNVLNSFEYIRLQNNNQVEVHISDEIPKSLNGNAVRLSQILMNLLGNAFKFTENGVITVDVRFISNIDGTVTLRFSIKDTGIGIAKEKQKGIFNEFEQIESIDYSYQGTGLGLPIVKKLLTLSNSKIHLESELGKGALFSFELFYEEAPQEDSEILETSLDTTVLKGKHILIVEDNRINQIVTQKILEKKGIICSLVENGDLAIEAVRVTNFVLVLMDLNMPVKGGIAAS
jgi:signal transduction histidine kinase